jgi:hypothetical protein
MSCGAAISAAGNGVCTASWQLPGDVVDGATKAKPSSGVDHANVMELQGLQVVLENVALSLASCPQRNAPAVRCATSLWSFAQPLRRRSDASSGAVTLSLPRVSGALLLQKCIDRGEALSEN